MKYRTRTFYTAEQKAQMWDRWERGDSDCQHMLYILSFIDLLTQIKLRKSRLD